MPDLSLVLAVLAVAVMLGVAAYATPRLARSQRDLARPPGAVARRALTVLFVGLSIASVLTVAAVGLAVLRL